ncbi:mycofactocin biosynthesis glycosyltransferase MftF [Aeromicrobium sp.]|uniref:mycofactocin biosynthesis glycosyltransferase MftF n=1 Tax=Aeromicrobium sp. TaxID=1871063 RepID=UPI0025C0CC64|nr:mycofactocin biosynthesis glycosyltransferase MftF [Aeromicrobium sp.]
MAGLRVRLHDDVRVGQGLTRGARMLRLDPRARDLLRQREVDASSPLGEALVARLLDLDLAVPILTQDGPFSLADVTVVVPVRDRAAGVDRLLARLGGRLACVVVDDASRDSAALAAVVARHGADLVRLPVNVGPAAARNVGLRRVTTPLVAFVDSDVAADPADLEALLPHFVDPALAAVAPRVWAEAGARWFQRYERSAGGLDLGPVPAAVRPWSAVAYVPSACLVARVDRLGGGFDGGLRSGEDVDLVWRLLSGGHRVRHEPGVVVAHEQRPTVRGWLGRQLFYGTSAAPLAQRHDTQVAPAVLTPLQAALLVSVPLSRGRGRWSTVALAAVVAGQVWRHASGEPAPERARLAVAALGGTSRQGAGLVLRHAAPLTIALALVSRRVRRTVMVVAVAEGLAAWSDGDRQTDPLTFVAARRASDVAYGSGVWWGAARHRMLGALLPHVVRRPRRRS